MISMDTGGQDLFDVVRTSGRSMAPLIADNSIIRFVRVSSEAVIPGDIIVFRQEGRLVAHRLIATRASGATIELREKGDNCLRATWVPGASLMGKAVELRCGQSSRMLDGGGRLVLIRWLTFLSRLEADVIERYVRVKARGGVFALLKWVMLPAAVLAAPFRYLVVRMLLTAYPLKAQVDSIPALRYILGVFRNLFRNQAVEPDFGKDIDDWNMVFEIAAVHGILPLMGRGADGGGSNPELPLRAREELKKQSYRIALNHTMTLQAMREITRVLSAADVSHAVLKGPFLYEWLYRDMFPREYEDVDILVSPGQVSIALTTLESIGYRMSGGRLVRAFTRIGHFHFAMKPSRRGWPPVELHWSLVDRGNLYRIRDSECLARIRPFGTGGDSFTVLSIEDQFIYLCLHAVKHGAINFIGLMRRRDAVWFCRPNAGNRLLWFADIALLLRKSMDDMNWQLLCERAALWNVTEDVCECLSVMDIVAPGSPARSALNRLLPGAQRDAVLNTGDPQSVEAHSEGEFARLTVTDRLLDWAMRMNPAMSIRPIRILLLGRLFFPSPRRLLVYHGVRTPWLLPWLYLRHPFNIIGKLLNLTR